MSGEGPRARERRFYDRVAGGLAPEDMGRPRPDPYAGSLLEALGPLRGRRVLEAGSGTGDLSLELLERGAELTALDVSPGMVEVARRRAGRLFPGASATWVAAALEDTGLPDAAFDLVVGKWVLHHADVVRAGAEVRRVRGHGRVLREPGP